MAIKLMYITNRPDVACIAEKAGVDRVFVDLETIGKQERQGGMDTVQSKHTISDIAEIRKVLTKAQLLVRSNPVHEGSRQEIDAIVEAGADIIMLPYFKTLEEVRLFISFVNGRSKTMLLFETPEAVELVDEILALDGIDEVFIGLNDLSLGYGKKFMFELLADGTVERLCEKFKEKGYNYGFGGIAAIGKGDLPAECILKEHCRLGSTAVILSRSFCNISKIDDFEKIEDVFFRGVGKMREKEKEIDLLGVDFEENRLDVKKIVNELVEKSGK